MIEVRLSMTLANQETWRRHYATRTVVIPGIPRVGDGVLVASDGWEEDVRSVYWDLENQTVNVVIGGAHTRSGCVEFESDNDDRLDVARAAGWEVS